MGVDAQAQIDSRFFGLKEIAYIIQYVIGAEDVKAYCAGDANNTVAMMDYMVVTFDFRTQDRQLNFHSNNGFMGSHTISMASDFSGQNITRTIAEIVGGVWTPDDSDPNSYRLFPGVYDSGKDTMFLLRWAVSRGLVSEGTPGDLQTAVEEFKKDHPSVHIR